MEVKYELWTGLCSGRNMEGFTKKIREK